MRFPIISALLLAPTLARAATKTYSNDDAAVTYSPTTMPKGSCKTSDLDSCQNSWWVQTLSTGRTMHQTFGTSASLTFKFTGSKVTFNGYTSPSGGEADISVDGAQTQRLNFKSNDGSISWEVPMWTSQGLTVGDHTVRLDYVASSSANAPDAKWVIGVNSFLVDNGSSSGNNISEGDTEYTAKDNRDKVISLAAGLSGGFALLLVLMACLFYWYKRRTTDAAYYGRPLHPIYSNGYVEQGYHNPGGPMQPGYMQQHPAYHPAAMHNAGSGSGLHVIDPFATPPRAGSNVTSSSSGAGPNAHHHLRHHQYTSSSSALMPNGSHHDLPAQQPQYPPQPQPRPRVDVSHDDGHALRPPERPWPASPSTETTHSYESWTSSDFGPVPSPFIANGRTLPPSSGGDEKARRNHRQRSRVAGPRRHQSTRSTQPPPYDEAR
ncbi:hypothetical protein AURDEDRAFT_173028 [Auricularia subglabra TFB-10046 SS5]|uniref:Mid2 domain-containing protein n=1 Tax=Auricularia subglabra (strain TFB-10046 / SS5) TaxID=717982 RepID=J0WUZ6_AURST|nr:hypothetical protein AURDEDRAFT_173028 [Auricularia subglabra TFB-10046 SS5]